MSAVRGFSILSSSQIAERLVELPTLPTIVYELNRVINNPMSSLGDVETIMANDPSMTTQVLKLANSAYYAIPGGVSSLKRAIGYVGFDVIQQLVLSMSIIKALKVGNAGQFDMRQFWKHSLGVGISSEVLAGFVGYRIPGDLFTCGLVHDIGKIAMYIIQPEVFEMVLARAAEKNINIAQAERELEIPSHTLVGQLLAQRWLLPNQIQSVIRYHHEIDRKRRGGLSSEMNLVVDIVYLGNLLTHALKIGSSGHQQSSNVPMEVLERIQLDQAKLKDLVVKVQQAVGKADGFLKIICGNDEP